MPEEKDKKQEECLECKKKQKDARWREDFPVNWESDNYVTRREMVKFLALGFADHRRSECRGRGSAAHRQSLGDAQNAGSPWPLPFLLADRSCSPIQQKKIHASWFVKATAIWLHIPRCARIFPVP